MLLIQTSLNLSKINGIGLFASEFIPAGTVTWRYSPPYDQSFAPEQINSLEPHFRDALTRYAYLSRRTNLWILCSDNARFFNHSSNPNIGDRDSDQSLEGVDYALRDIQAGEELTCDYRLFDAHSRNLF